jgi:hypothetical protein
MSFVTLKEATDTRSLVEFGPATTSLLWSYTCTVLKDIVNGFRTQPTCFPNMELLFMRQIVAAQG